MVLGAEIPTSHYMVLSAALFVIGVVGFLSRRNIIVVFMSLELMLNAVNVNMVGFANRLASLSGQIFAMMIITVAAAEAAVGLAILVVLFRNRNTVNADEVSSMKW